MRPQEISNNPGIARRLGVIATNTAIEVDIYGHANSTHFFGTQIMNGLGGSGDFERNAYPVDLHVPVDRERRQGFDGRADVLACRPQRAFGADHRDRARLADLRGLSPIARARRIIDCCAHPAYRDYLHHYIERSPSGHIRHDLRRCFELHNNYIEHGAMLPDLSPSLFETGVKRTRGVA